MLRESTCAGLGLALLLPAVGSLQADPIPSLSPSTPPTITEVGGKTLKQWMKDFDDGDPSVREEAIRAVTLFPNANEAVLGLVGRLHDGDASPRSAAVIALGTVKIDDKDRARVVEALGARLMGDETQSPIRFQIARVLGGMGKDARGALAALVHGVEDPGSFEIRRACIADLAAVGETDKGPEPSVTRALLTALGDRAAGVRLEAIMVMSELGRPDDGLLLGREVAAIKEATKDRDRTVAIWAHVGLMALDKIDDAGIAFLKQCTNTDELLRVRVQAVRALGMVGAKQPGEVVPTIVALLADKDPELAGSACLALADVGDPGPKAEAALVAVGGDAGQAIQVRVTAVRALGAIGAKSKAVVGPLLAFLLDKDHDVAANACMALGSLKDPPLGVEEKLSDLSKNKEVEEGVREAALAALEMIRKPRK